MPRPLLIAVLSSWLAVVVAAQTTTAPGAAATESGKSTLRVDLDGVPLDLFLYRPSTYVGERMLMVVHGVLRNADEYRDHAVGLAERFGMLVVAPRFDEERFPSIKFQRGGLLDAEGKPQPPTARTYALVPKIAAAMRRAEGRPDLPYWIIGHSAGGQFVARMAAFQNTGAVRLVAANSGSWLFPTREFDFGYGFGGLPAELADDTVLERFLAAPLTLYLGTADDAPDRHFDAGPKAMLQGSGRHQRGLACYWMARTLATARGWRFEWRLAEAPGVGHDHAMMFDHAACETALFGTAPQERPTSRPLTRPEMEEDLNRLKEAVQSEWSYHDDRMASGLDVDSLVHTAHAEAAAVRDASGFRTVLRRFIAALGDGHAGLHFNVPIDEKSRWLPFRVAPCREGLCVVAVDGAEGPRRGDLLLSVAGRPVADVLADLEAETFASTPGMRRSLAIEDLHRQAAPTVPCTFMTESGTTRELTVKTADVPPAEPPLPYDSTEIDLGWPADDVARLRLPTFKMANWDAWLKADLTERDAFLADTRARLDDLMRRVTDSGVTTLILDLRDNGGGTDLLGIHLAERLLDAPFQYFLLSSRIDGKWTKPAGLTYGAGGRGRGRGRGRRTFSGRVIALVNEGCFSAADNFLRCLDDRRADFTVIGRPTGGGTGAPRLIITLPNSRAEVTLCTQRVHGPAGRLIEGRGTTPDIAVEWTREDWLTGRDPDMAAALKLAAGEAGR